MVVGWAVAIAAGIVPNRLFEAAHVRNILREVFVLQKAQKGSWRPLAILTTLAVAVAGLMVLLSLLGGGDSREHRWYIFPHSFTSELVHALIEDWGLGPQDHLLDPFCGAGTALVAAKERGVPATGYDLSPLAVLVSETKASNYDCRELMSRWKELKDSVGDGRWSRSHKSYPDLVEKALPNGCLGPSKRRQLRGCVRYVHLSLPSRFSMSRIIATLSQHSLV